MKFVKENLTLVICGAVVLLAIVGFWYMSGPALASVQADMKDRYEQTTARIKGNTNKELVFPGGAKRTGVPSDANIKVKADAIKTIEGYKEEVAGLSRTTNSAGRVTEKGVALLPTKAGTKSLEGFLPNLAAPAMAFKADYLALFRDWRASLTGSSGEPLAFMPPTVEELTKLWTEQQERIKASAAPGALGAGGGVENTKEKNLFYRNKITARASGLRMYVDLNGFQVRPWGLNDDPPGEQQIFEALVDSWIQSDIVKAINDVNTTNGHDINKSPVKRLTRIVIGNSAKNRSASPTGAVAANQVTDGGPLFFTAANANAGGGMGGPGGTMTPVPVGGGPPGAPGQPAVEVLPNKVDYQYSLTGHSGGMEYDVVLFSVVVDIAPQSLNNFVDKLYRKNMGYIELNRNIKTVDPIERVANGYLYGNGDVVEAELLFEAIMFRSWTQPLMPKAVRQMLSIPDPQPK